MTTSNDTPEVNLKQCLKCGETYPLTSEYWQKKGDKKGGFRTPCKLCQVERNRRFYKENADKERERNRSYREENADKERERNRLYREKNADKVRQSQQRYRKENAHNLREKRRRYPKNVDLEKSREYNRRWYKKNIDKARKRRRKYYAANAEKICSDNRQRYNVNPDKHRIYVQRRLARKRGLSDAYTPDDWNYALSYFNGCCAVCGRQLNDLFGEHTAAMDHWIPLSSDDCPGTIPENIIPLCHGIDGCNNKKSGKDPEAWLTETYGTRKARQIVARIQSYFKTIKAQIDE